MDDQVWIKHTTMPRYEEDENTRTTYENLIVLDNVAYKIGAFMQQCMFNSEKGYSYLTDIIAKCLLTDSENILCQVLLMASDPLFQKVDIWKPRAWEERYYEGSKAEELIKSANSILIKWDKKFTVHKYLYERENLNCKYALSHVQRQCMPEEALATLFQETSGNCWIDVLCQDDFDAIKCGWQYNVATVYVYDDVLYNATSPQTLQIAVLTSHWLYRGWIAQEIIFAHILKVITINGIYELRYDQNLENCAYYSVTMDGMQCGGICLPALINRTTLTSYATIKKLCTSEWTRTGDILHAFNAIHGREATSLYGMVQYNNTAARLIMEGINTQIDDWCWATNCKNSLIYKKRYEAKWSMMLDECQSHLVENMGMVIAMKGITRLIEGKLVTQLLTFSDPRLNVQVHCLHIKITNKCILFVVENHGTQWYVINKVIVDTEDILDSVSLPIDIVIYGGNITRQYTDKK